MEVIQTFNNLQNKTVKRGNLIELQKAALKDGPYHIYTRITNVLNSNPKTKRFDISVSPCDDERDFCGLSYSPNYISNDEIGLAKAVSPNEIYDYITKIVIETIEVSGHLPWQRSWDKGMYIWDGVQAVNYDSKKPYRGINYWFTNFKIVIKKGKHELVPRDLTNPYFLTRNQIKKHKGSIKKGSKGIRVFYFTKLYSHTEILPNKKKLSISTYDKKKYLAWLEKHKNSIKSFRIEYLAKSYIPILKYYNVFHGADVSGIKWDSFKKNKNPKLPKKDRIEIAENIIKAMPNAPEILYKGNQPAYYPSFDHVRMTPIEVFKNEQSYYSTLFHELVHSTGHTSRLGRFKGGRNDEKAYAFEELIAEMGAVFLCAESGILFSVINNSASYLASWNKSLVGKLKKDNRYFFRASSKAQAATDYILHRDKNNVPAYQKIKPKKIEPKKRKRSSKQLKLALAGKQTKLTKKQQVKAEKEAIAKALDLEYNQVFQPNGRLRSGFVYEGPGKVKHVNKKPLSRKRTQAQPAKRTKEKGLSKPQGIPSPKPTPKIPGLVSMNDKVVKPPLWEIAGETGKFLQAVERKPVESVAIVLSTPAGTGKTTSAYKWINDFAKRDKVLFVTLEEHHSSSLAIEKRDKYIDQSCRKNINTVSDIPDKKTFDTWINLHDVIVIDSWQKLEKQLGRLHFDEDLRKAFHRKIFVVIFQQTTTGRARGGADKVFDGDIIVFGEKGETFADNYLYFDKNRYAQVDLGETYYNIARGETYNPKQPTIEKQTTTHTFLMID